METLFVAGVRSAYLSNSRQAVRSNSLSPSFVDTVELNCDNDNEWSDNDNDSESDDKKLDKNKLRSKKVRKTKRKQRQKNKAFKELVAQERDNREVSNPPPKRKNKSLTDCLTTINEGKFLVNE